MGGTKLSQLIVHSGRRKIILKSKLKNPGHDSFRNIVAMRNAKEGQKRPDLRGTYLTKSIEMQRGLDPLGQTNRVKNKKLINDVLNSAKEHILVRTYPNRFEGA